MATLKIKKPALPTSGPRSAPAQRPPVRGVGAGRAAPADAGRGAGRARRARSAVPGAPGRAARAAAAPRATAAERKPPPSPARPDDRAPRSVPMPPPRSEAPRPGATGRPTGSSRSSHARRARLRLSKRMSELGIASRREADEWIAQGLGAGRRPASSPSSAHACCRGSTSRSTRRRGTSRRGASPCCCNKPVGYVSGQAEDGYEPAVGAGHAAATSGARTARARVHARAPAQPRAGRAPGHRLGRPAGADAGRPHRASS